MRRERAAGLEIRDARPADRRALTSFMVALQEVERALHPERAAGRRIARRHVAYLERCAAKRTGRVLVAMRGSQALGFLVGWVEREEPGDVHVRAGARSYGVVTDLYVVPGARGRGVARRLMDEAAGHFSRLGLGRLRVRTLAANLAAIRFYRALGYRPYETILERPLRVGVKGLAKKASRSE